MCAMRLLPLDSSRLVGTLQFLDRLNSSGTELLLFLFLFLDARSSLMECEMMITIWSDILDFL